MSYQITGKLFISGCMFWDFVQKATSDLAGETELMFGNPTFNRGDWCMGIAVVSPENWNDVEIDLTELWVFVNSFLPNPSDEVVYGKPVWNEEAQELEVDFAASPDSNPMNWGEVPAFAEWSDK